LSLIESSKKARRFHIKGCPIGPHFLRPPQQPWK
jgi:hypothetical protein